MTKYAVILIGTVLAMAIGGCKSNKPTDGGGGGTIDSLVVGIQFPPDSAVIGDAMLLQAGVIGSAGGTVVKFLVDAVLIATDSAAPFQTNWDPVPLPNGSSHKLQVIASDKDGRADTSVMRTMFAKWRLLATGTATASPRNIRRIFARSTDVRLEFRVEFDSNWSDYKSGTLGIDCALFIDADRSNTTGATTTFGGTQPIGDIGADYRVIVGYHGDSLWTYTGAPWASNRTLRTLKVASPSNVFEFAIWHGDIGGPAAIDLATANVDLTTNIFDWVPSSGHASYTVDQKYFGPPIAAPPGNPLISR